MCRQRLGSGPTASFSLWQKFSKPMSLVGNEKAFSVVAKANCSFKNSLLFLVVVDWLIVLIVAEAILH